VLVSPAYHRRHHDPDIQTANLGVVFTVWDVLAGFATFPSCHDAAGRTGLNGRPVPVEQDARRAGLGHHGWMVPFSTPPLAALKLARAALPAVISWLAWAALSSWPFMLSPE